MSKRITFYKDSNTNQIVARRKNELIVDEKGNLPESNPINWVPVKITIGTEREKELSSRIFNQKENDHIDDLFSDLNNNSEQPEQSNNEQQIEKRDKRGRIKVTGLTPKQKRVLELLNQNPMTFKQIHEITKFGPTFIRRCLKEILPRNGKQIKITKFDDGKVYSID